jgi:hypothetical protein
MSCIGSERNRSIGGQQPPPRATSPIISAVNSICDDLDKTEDRGEHDLSLNYIERDTFSPSSSSSYCSFVSLSLLFPIVVDQIEFIFYFSFFIFSFIFLVEICSAFFLFGTNLFGFFIGHKINNIVLKIINNIVKKKS